MNYVLPTFYPTTVVFVDDEPETLGQLIKATNLKHSPHKTFTDARACLGFLNADTYRQELANRLVVADESDQGDALSFDVDDLLRDLNTRARYNQISVLVVDYEMPGMRGLDMCDQLNNPHVKKILLTGVADENVAVEAFNEGKIDRYIRKHDPNFIRLLKQAIIQFQHDYFRSLFQVPLEALAKRFESTALTDPVFAKFFENLLQTHDIQEYYLVNGMGSFLMVDREQAFHSLITVDDCILDLYLNRDFMDDAGKEVEEKIQRQMLIPCYYAPFSSDPYSPPGDDLRPHLRVPHVLKGARKTYLTQFGKDFIHIAPGDVALWKPA